MAYYFVGQVGFDGPDTFKNKKQEKMVHQSALQEFSDKKINLLFWQYALPAIIGTCVSTLYNIIDGVFIGHWIGKEALAAAGLLLPVMNFAAAVGMLVGIGSAARISLYLGLGEHEKAEQVAGASFVLSLVLSSITIVFLLVFLKPILMQAGASEVTYPYARDFLQVFLPGSLFLTLMFNYNNMMRACGYPFKAMVTMFISVIANVILAPVFIIWLGWGMKGAALATVLSMMIGFAFVMQHFLSKNNPIRLRKKNLKLRANIVKGIVSIGMSPFCMQMAATAIVILVNKQLNHYAASADIFGDDAIAAFANANRWIMLVIMIGIGINQGIQPIIGYNYGAHHYERVREVFIYAVKVATGVTTLGFVLGVFFPEALVKAFSTDPAIVQPSATALRYMTFAFAVIGFQMVTVGLFQSIGMARISILLSLSRQLLILVPALLVLPMFFGLNGVWLAAPISDLISTGLAGAMLFWQLKLFRAKNP